MNQLIKKENDNSETIEQGIRISKNLAFLTLGATAVYALSSASIAASPQERVELIKAIMPPLLGLFTTSGLLYTGFKTAQVIKKFK